MALIRGAAQPRIVMQHVHVKYFGKSINGERVMLYQPFEPFELPRKKVPSGQKVLDFSAPVLKTFWAEVDEEYPCLPGAKGCYIFAIKAGKGIRPWYVGQTQKSFAQECFQPQKRNHYTEASHNNKKGTPLLLLLARTTAGGKFTNGAVDARELDFVEQMLIGLALGQNKELLNKKTTKYMRHLKLPGVLNTNVGPPTEAVKKLRLTLGQ
jgi:hypothetical protein